MATDMDQGVRRLENSPVCAFRVGWKHECFRREAGRAGAARVHDGRGARPAGCGAGPTDRLPDSGGQHGVYCASTRNPSKPALDLQAVLGGMDAAKELIQSVMEELRKGRDREQGIESS